MRIDIRHLSFPVSDALQQFTDRRITRALRPFHAAVSRVNVRTKDVNGPRGGTDIECRVTVTLAAIEQPVVVTSKSADAYAAIQRASARLHEAVSRALGRRRRLARVGTSASRAKRQRTAAIPHPSHSESAATNDETADRVSEIVVTTTDIQRLRKLIQSSRDARDRDAVKALADELGRAQVVPAQRIAGNVVTMNSRVVFKDEGTGERREVSLVYPRDSDPTQGRISILAPVGAALLGLAVGQTIDWPLPRGRQKRYRVVKVKYQPEAAGRLNL